MQLSQIQKIFYEFFCSILKSSLNFEQFKKRMTLRAAIFIKLRTSKNLVRSISKNSRFRWSFEKQDGKQTQTLLKFQRQNFYDIYWSMWRQLNCKRSLLNICKTLRVFVNILSVNDKFSLLNRDNLIQWIQMQLSQKQKTFSQCFSTVFKSSLTF